MFNILSRIQKNLVWSIPITMVLGLTLGYFQDSTMLKVLILPLTFLMVYPMMINIDLKKLMLKGNTKAHITAQMINFGLIPFVALLIGRVFLNDPYLELGLLLAALLPTSGMTISWTGFAKGNLNVAIKMTIIGLIVGSIATPLYIKMLLGAVVEIPLLNIFKQITLIVFLPIIAGNLTRRFIISARGEDYFKSIKHKFPPISTLGVLGIVFVAMALKSKSILENPLLMLNMMIPLLILYLFNFVCSTLIARYFFSYEEGIALVYGTVMRNLSIALAIAMTVFKDKGADIAIIISMAYIIQVQAGAWYLKVSRKLLVKAPADLNIGPEAMAN